MASVEALIGTRFALMATKVTQRMEMQTIQRELSELHGQMEDVVDTLMSEAEQFADTDQLPIIYSTYASTRLREEPGVYSRSGRVVLDTLSALRGKMDMSTKLSGILSQTLNHFKQQCDELSLKVESLTHEFAEITAELNFAESEKQQEEMKECRSCKRYLTKIGDFSKEVVLLREELTKTEGVLIAKQMEREQLSKEIANLTSKNKELEKELRRIPPLGGLESLDLQRELKKTEMTVSDLESQLKASRDAAEALKSSYLESQCELEPRETALRKAQSIIKKLNLESEKLTEQLHETERLSELFKRDAHQYEKSYRDAQIQLQTVDIMQKTETRLREEVQALKETLTTVKADSSEEIGRLKEYINQLIKENQGLQGQTVELETSIVELDKEAKERESLVSQLKSQLSDLQSALSQKASEIQQILHECDLREEECEAELAHIKRVAENTIRSMQHSSATVADADDGRMSSRSPLRASMMPLKKQAGVKRTSTCQLNTTLAKPSEDRKDPTPEDHEGVSVDYYRGQLDEAIYRENSLKKAIQSILTRSATFLRERVKNLELLETAMRPETERWMMRCEELEMIIASLGGRLVRSLGINRDLQKMALVKERQMEEIKKTSDSLLKDYQSALQSLQSESNNRGDLILTDLLPKSSDLIAHFSNSLIHQSGEQRLHEESISDLRSEIAAKHSKMEQIVSDLRRVEDLLEAARGEIAGKESDLEWVRKAVAGDVSETCSVASGVEMKRIDIFGNEAGGEERKGPSREVEDLIHSIQSLHQTLVSKSQDMDRLEVKFRELIASNKELQQVFEEDKDSLSVEIRTLTDHTSQLEADLRDVTGRLRSEKAQKEATDSEKKRLEIAVSDLKSKLSACETAHSGANQTKESLQRQFSDTLSHVQRLESELMSLRGANERLLEDLNNAHDDVTALIRYKDQVVEQNEKIERLQDQLSTLGGMRREETRTSSIGLSGRDTEDLSLTRSRGRSQTRSDAAAFLSIDRLLTQKDDYIKELEHRLHSAPLDDSCNADSDRVKRLKTKVAGYKRSFNKRLEEFESVLHLIEDAVSAVAEGREVKTEWRPRENESLEAWTNALVGKIEEMAGGMARVRDREIRTYVGAFGMLQTSEANEEEKLSATTLISSLQNQSIPDLDFVSTQLLSLLKRVIHPSSDARKAVTRSYAPEDIVQLTSYHARLLIAAVSSLDNVEIGLIERKESLLQVAEELEGLTHSLAETSVRSQAEVASKIADMFSKFSVQFLQDLKRDLQELGEALRDLREVTRSSPSIPGKGHNLSALSQTGSFRRA